MNRPQVSEVREGVIRAYFRDFAARVNFLNDLHNQGRVSEALILCCCYIEALGTRLNWGLGSAHTFVRAASDYGGNDVLSLIHPRQLTEALRDRGGKRRLEIAERLEAALTPWNGELLSREDLLRLPALDKEQADVLERTSWRGSVAMIAYGLIRSQGVHNGRCIPVEFGKATHNGAPIERLDFHSLFSVLQSVLHHVERECLANPELFDFKPRASGGG